MPGAAHLVYSEHGGNRYATVMRSIRNGKETRKERVLYLGRVLDAERGIYKNKSQGVFSFDLKTLTCSSAPADFVDSSKRKNAREELIVDFGDAFLFNELVTKYGMSQPIAALEYGNPDSVRALLLYYMLSTRSNAHANTWYDGSYARILFPNANLTSQRISDLLSAIGREDAVQRFFNSYLSILGAEVKSGVNILIDSTGLPNSVRFPLTALNNHNGIISEEVRLIYVVQQGTRLPIYMRYVPGNIIDSTTLVTTMRELKAMGVKTKFAILDAGYLTEEGMLELRSNNISFVTRCPSNRSIYKEVLLKNLNNIFSPENLVLDSAGRLYNGREVYMKCVPVSYMGMSLYAYIGKDMTTAQIENKRYTNRIHGSRKKIDPQLFYDDVNNLGIFMILSTRRIKTSELLPTYYIRQEIEQVFDISKNYARLLPLNVENEDTFRGHLLITFTATVILQRLQMEIKESSNSIDSILSTMRNQHAKIFENVVIPSEACKQQNDIYKLLNIKHAKEYRRS